MLFTDPLSLPASHRAILLCIQSLRSRPLGRAHREFGGVFLLGGRYAFLERHTMQSEMHIGRWHAMRKRGALRIVVSEVTLPLEGSRDWESA
jgi:hypothetical protein